MITPEQQTKQLLTTHGTKGLQIAKETLNNRNIPPAIKNIATYFLEENWPNTHHPALMALCCKAVNGDPSQTHEIAAAVVLMTGAADIHDDIIDKTKLKSQKVTPYGKFDTDLVLLTGDMLLFQGLTLLHKGCEKLSTNTKQEVLDLINFSFLKIGHCIVNELSFKGKPLNVNEYRKIVESKGAVAQACAEIGATIGHGKPEAVKALSDVGKALGILMAVKNEFDDMQDLEELKGKLKNRLMPLPILYAAQDISAITQINALLQGKLTQQNAQTITEIAMATEPVKKLRQEMRL